MAVISLVRPPLLKNKSASEKRMVPPLGLAYIAGSLLQDNHQVHFVDGIGGNPMQSYPSPSKALELHGLTLDEIIAEIHPQSTIIGVTSMFSCEWPVVRNLVERIRIRFPHAAIILGGESATALSEFCLRQCRALDFIVLGEGEVTIRELAAAIEKGTSIADIGGVAWLEDEKYIDTSLSKRTVDVDSIAEPAWHLVPLENYYKKEVINEVGFGPLRGSERTLPIVASRGCPFQCTFCSSPSMWTTRWVARDPEKLIGEMKKYVDRYQISNFQLFDLTAILKRDWIINFCKLLIESGLNITWQLPAGTRSEALDQETLPLLYKSGYRNLIFAPESGSKKVLKMIKKKVNLKVMKKSMRICVREGINAHAFIVMGFPGETKLDILKTLYFLAELAFVGIGSISISPFAPYPGSELFRSLQEKNMIGELNDQYFYNLSNMTDLSDVNYTGTFSNRFLIAAQKVGYLLFYGLQYSLRPQRFVKLVKNIMTNQHETHFEKELAGVFNRLVYHDRIPSSP